MIFIFNYFVLHNCTEYFNYVENYINLLKFIIIQFGLIFMYLLNSRKLKSHFLTNLFWKKLKIEIRFIIWKLFNFEEKALKLISFQKLFK